MATSVDYFNLFPENYKWVCLGVTGLTIECFLLGLVYINYIRGKIFPKTFMEDNFGETHQAIFQKPPPVGGYGDTGNGKFSDKLKLKDWFDFNTAFRGHINFVEGLPFMVIISLLSGLYYPQTTAILVACIFFFRLLFIVGYVVSPALRAFGFAPSLLAQVVLIVLFLIGFFKQMF